MPRSSDIHSIASVAQLIGFVLVAGVLYVASEVLIPITLAVLFSFLLSPIVNRLQRLGIGNALAVVTTAFMASILLAGAVTLVGKELAALLTDVPVYKEELISKARDIAGLDSGVGEQLDDLAGDVIEALEGGEGKAAAAQAAAAPPESSGGGATAESSQLIAATEPESKSSFPFELFPGFGGSKDTGPREGLSPLSPIYVQPVGDRTAALLSWAGTVGTVLGPLGTVGLVGVLVLFLLFHREELLDRLVKVISRGNYVTTAEALGEVSQRISRYLFAQTCINTGFGIVLGLGLYLIGIVLTPTGEFPNFVLWGVLATLLRFVPYLGPVVAAVFPLLLSIAVFPGYQVPLAVLSLIVVLELTSNNLVEPLLYGASTGLSAIAIIFAAVFWGWMWGPVGLLLSTPLTVCLVVLGKHVPRFRYFATLLGDEVMIRPFLRFYQRLLSADPRRIQAFLQEFVDERGVEETLDRVVVPALKRITKDHQAETLAAKDVSSFLDNIEQATTKLDWPSKELILGATPLASESAEEGEPRILKIVGCSAHDRREEILLRMFATANPSVDCRILSFSQLPDAVAQKAAVMKPDVVLISALPQGGYAQARTLCQTIRHAGYTGIILVCFSGRFRHYDKLFVRFRKAGASYLTTSWTQAVSKLGSITVPAASVKPKANVPPPKASSTEVKSKPVGLAGS